MIRVPGGALVRLQPGPVVIEALVATGDGDTVVVGVVPAASLASDRYERNAAYFWAGLPSTGVSVCIVSHYSCD